MVRFEFSGPLGEVYAEMQDVLVGHEPDEVNLDTLPLQELIARIEARCLAEGYVLTIEAVGVGSRRTADA